jgi:hypothetical protein
MTQDRKPAMVDAMAIWEAVLDSGLTDELRTDGMCGLRDAVAGIVQEIVKAWQTAQALGFDESFDWEFCPKFIQRAYEWSKLGDADFFETVQVHYTELGAAIAGYVKRPEED